jgi:hypothetical protein
LIWKVAYTTKDGEEIGNYWLVVEGFEKAYALQRNGAAAFNFAQSMKQGIDWLIENAKFIWPQGELEEVPSLETLEAMFQSSDSFLLGEEVVFEAATVSAESLFDCLEELGIALLEVLTV